MHQGPGNILFIGLILFCLASVFASDTATATRGRREPISRAVRSAVWARDGGRCVWCQRGAADGVKLEMGHIIPWSKGGSDTVENLQVECQYHNRSAGNRI